MPISLKVDLSELERAAQEVEGTVEQTRERTRRSANVLADRIQQRVRADIRGAGNFGARWTDGFQVAVTEEGDAVTLTGTMAVPYWRVFQYGATIRGNPWLWFTPKPGTVQGKGGFTLNPTVIRKRSVTIPKKFHLREIVEEEIERAGQNLDRLTFE